MNTHSETVFANSVQTPMKLIARFFLIISLATVAACDRPVEPNPTNSPVDIDPVASSLQMLANNANVDIVDISVPFERFLEAPDKLRQAAELIQTNQSGLYVMRYYDDTVTHIVHSFLISDDRCKYVKLTTTPSSPMTRSESNIHTADYNEETKTLVLTTSTGDIVLTAQDVTSAGA